MRGLPSRLGYAMALLPVPLCLRQSDGRLGLSAGTNSGLEQPSCTTEECRREKKPRAGSGGASAAVGTCCVKNKLSE